MNEEVAALLREYAELTQQRGDLLIHAWQVSGWPPL